MLTIERQKEIRNLVLEQKSVSVAELTARFGVSFETIRRDLKVLENEGVIEKSYGGAILKQRVNTTADYQVLSQIMVDSKKRMAELATRLITPGDCIYIDFSTTCGHIAVMLGHVPVTVLTNSLPVMNELAANQSVTLFSTGGSWDERNRAFMGRTTKETLSQYHFDKSFISCRAISMENGLSDKTEAESEIRRKIVEVSNEVYLLADYSKFDKIAFVKTSNFDRIRGIITDKPLNAQWQAFLQDNGIRYYDSETSVEPEDGFD